MRVINRTRGSLLAENVQVASTYWARMVGLLGRGGLEPGHGLLLRGEKAIHMLGMRFAIDVLYIDREGRVLAALEALKPWRLGPYLKNSRDVLELPVGTLAATHTQKGDELVFE